MGRAARLELRRIRDDSPIEQIGGDDRPIVQRIFALGSLSYLPEKVNRLPCPAYEVTRRDVGGEQQALQAGARSPALHNHRETGIGLARNA